MPHGGQTAFPFQALVKHIAGVTNRLARLAAGFTEMLGFFFMILLPLVVAGVRIRTQ
jgi:hypothetical protein